MTVLEAIRKLGVPHPVFNDRLNIGQKKIDRLLGNMEYNPLNGCWIWQRARVKGYGVVKIRSLANAILPVHRLCYELANGPVDKSMHVHHRVEEPVRCSGRGCGNPDHVTPLTPQEHLTKFTPGNAAYVASNRNCCAAGHPYTAESTRVLNSGFRQCRICDRIRAQARRDAKHPDRPKFKKDPATFKTHCLRGHALDGPESSVYMMQTKWGPQRRCRLCDRERSQDLRSKKTEGKTEGEV